MSEFKDFLEKNIPTEAMSLDVDLLSSEIQKQFCVAVPEVVRNLWTICGSGYFGDRSLFVFGERAWYRDDICSWNKMPFFTEAFPSSLKSRPFFFCETCFGGQIGFRRDGNKTIFELFIIDTYEMFVVADSDEKLVTELSVPHPFIDRERFLAVRTALGQLGDGMHYAPVLSPLMGGDGRVSNFASMPANIHMKMAYSAAQTAAGLGVT